VQYIKGMHFLDKEGWIQMTRDHHAICELLKVFENFLSPLFFISYMVNVYYVCMQVKSLPSKHYAQTKHTINYCTFEFKFKTNFSLWKVWLWMLQSSHCFWPSMLRGVSSTWLCAFAYFQFVVQMLTTLHMELEMLFNNVHQFITLLM